MDDFIFPDSMFRVKVWLWFWGNVPVPLFRNMIRTRNYSAHKPLQTERIIQITFAWYSKNTISIPGDCFLVLTWSRISYKSHYLGNYVLLLAILVKSKVCNITCVILILAPLLPLGSVCVWVNQRHVWFTDRLTSKTKGNEYANLPTIWKKRPRFFRQPKVTFQPLLNLKIWFHHPAISQSQ